VTLMSIFVNSLAKEKVVVVHSHSILESRDNLLF